MNAAVIGYARLNPAGYGLTSKASLFAPDSVAFWEPDESNPFNFADAASRPSDGASRRHSPTCIIGTFGGRVEWIPLRTFFQLSAATNRNRLWCSPDTRDGH